MKHGLSPARQLLALLLIGGLGLLMALARSTPQFAWSWPVFALAVVLFLYVPGRTLVGLLGLELSALEHVTVSLALGMPASSLAYWLCGYFGLRWVFGLLVAAAALACARGLRRSAPWVALRARRAHLLLAGVIFCACAPFAISPFHFRDLAPSPGGGLMLFSEVDPVFHVAVTRELQHQIPPQVPFMPGNPLSYHYGGDLLAATLASAGVDAADVTLRYLPLLLMTFTALACFCCARAWLPSENAAALYAFLVILGEDLSFVPGLLLGAREGWSAHFFQMPTSFSLYSLNPMLPATGFLMCVLLCLERFFASERRGWLAAAALLGATLVEYKVFTAAHLLGALGLTALVYLVRFRSWAPVWGCAVPALSIAPLLLLASSGNAGRIQVTLGPWPYVSQAFERMGLAAPWPLVALPAYLLLAIGARAAGLGALARGLQRPQPAGAARYLAALLAVSGPVLTLLFVITPGGYAPGRAGDPDYNNSVWFFVHSKHVLWLFALAGVWGWARASRGRKLAGALLLVALSLPSTLQMFASFHARRLEVVDAPTVAMLAFVKREVPAGSVCLAREQVAPLLLLRTRCRTLEFDLYNLSFVAPAQQRLLQRSYQRFWQEWGRRPDLQAVRQTGASLSALNVDYLIAGRRSAPPGDELQAGAGRLLRRLFENERFVVFRVERAALFR